MLRKFTLSTVSCANLVKILEEVTGKQFFIHLDEISSTPEFIDVNREVTLLHQIWTEIKDARFQSQSEVFCFLVALRPCFSWAKEMIMEESDLPKTQSAFY